MHRVGALLFLLPERERRVHHREHEDQEEHDEHHNNVSYFRRRLLNDGLVDVSIVFVQTSEDSIQFPLRFRHQLELQPHLRPSGERARVTVIQAGH